MYWTPKTKIGKISFWGVIFSFAGVYVNYWIAMALQSFEINTTVVFPGIILMVLILIFGAMSFISLLKYKDKAILLILTSVMGLLGLLFVFAELLFPH